MQKLISFLFVVLLFAAIIFAQDKTTGGVKGTVKTAEGKAISGVTVEAKQEGKIVATGRTDNKGDFTIVGLKPGSYVFVFNKTGLSEGVSKSIDIKTGTMLTLKKLILTVDQGTIALVRGSVFDADGRIARNVKVEILKISGDSFKKIDEKVTDINGEFALRLSPNAASYRFVAKPGEAEPTSKDLNIDGAEVYRFAISLKPKKE